MSEKQFAEKISEWYQKNPRNLPWIQSTNIYHIWLSEIILQQTRVAYGKDYFIRFIKEFPTLSDLAQSPLEKVMKTFEGLGYYSRARNMHETAKFVHFELQGKFPSTSQELLKLKGIGPYTAAAIASFGFQEQVPAIDGNVNRVLSRYFLIEQAIDKSVGKKQIENQALSILKHIRAEVFNQAVMNFGALVCIPKHPKCSSCMLQKNCKAFVENRTKELPFKSAKQKIRNRYFTSFVVKTPQGILITERTENDIWKNLYDFYSIEHNQSEDWEKVLDKSNENSLWDADAVIEHVHHEKQKLSHQLIDNKIVIVKTTKKPVYVPTNFIIVDTDEILNYAFPKIYRNVLKKLVS